MAPELVDALNFYAGLTDPERLRFLPYLGYCLTISARNTYEVGTDEVIDPPKLRRFNEVFHRLFGHISEMTRGAPSRSDSDLIGTLLDHSDPALRVWCLDAFRMARLQQAWR